MSYSKFIKESKSANISWPETLYHGTVWSFNQWDPGRTKNSRVNQYTGVGIYLTASKQVAHQYASQPNNMYLLRDMVKSELIRLGCNKKGVDLYTQLVEQGDSVFQDLSAADMREIDNGMFKVNLISDLADATWDSLTARGQNNLDRVVSTFNNTMSQGGLSQVFLADLQQQGWDPSMLPYPQIHTFKTRPGENILYTDSIKAARSAWDDGYTAYVYSGPNTVLNEPEYVLKDSDQLDYIKTDKIVVAY